jgi:opacity protein-like surface antigen
MKHLKKTNYRLTLQVIFQKYRKKILKKIKLNAYKLSIKEKPIKLINIKFKIFEKLENKAQKRLISKKNQRSIIKKFYKIIYLIIFILANFMFFISQDCLAMIASESYQTSNKSKINIEENIIGLEFSSGFRFKLANDIFSDSLEITDKCYDQYQCQNNYQLSEISNNNFADNIFIEGEIFATKYLSKNINHSLGTRVNLGYNIKSFRIFASTGYLFTKVNYNLQNSENKNLKISQNKSLPFYGFGLGYDLTKNLSLRINSTFYQFDLSNPNISNSQSKISIKALSFGTAWHF